MSIEQEFWKTQQEELQQKLSDYEQCIETPFVPGELENWLAAVRKAFERLRPQLQLQTKHVHADEFAEIAEEDPGLSGRVEAMREEDRAVTALSEQIADWLDRLDREREHGASETDLKEELNGFVNLNLEFVTRVRKQEVAVRTWLVEAFTRDRGTVD